MKSVTTHIFTPDCPWLKDDAVFGVKESLIADFKDVNDPKKAAELGLPNPFKTVEWDFVLSKAEEMSKPCIICVAITGSLPTKENNPAVPITITEQIESTHEAFEAGATIAHCHVRDDEGKPTSDPERFARLKEGLEKHCPGMIVQLSTGGRSGAGKARGGMLPLKPDMASLTVGSNNFPTRVYENPPDLVDWLASEMLAYGIKPELECFDLSHIVQASVDAEGWPVERPALHPVRHGREECHAC